MNSQQLWLPAGGQYSIESVTILVWVGKADIPCFLAAETMVVDSGWGRRVNFLQGGSPW